MQDAHDIFDVVTPFNNGLEPDANPVVSGGLQFDNRKHPYSGLAPELEFARLLEHRHARLIAVQPALR